MTHKRSMKIYQKICKKELEIFNASKNKFGFEFRKTKEKIPF